jgi:low temperature requirement protein LtrA
VSLRRNFEHILAWCCVSGALAVAGGLAGPGLREGLWLAAVAVDAVGGMVGFWTPGLGRSAYHLIHPFMVAGIIVVAAADEIVVSDPAAGGAGAGGAGAGGAADGGAADGGGAPYSA